jgi:glycerate kinase
MLAAAEAGLTQIQLGLGGSATNDGGFGVACALGWTFRRADGSALQRWTELVDLASIEAPVARRWPREVVLVVDVENPLLGFNGATYTYGPQKGLTPEQLPLAEACLARLAVVVAEGQPLTGREPGAGAAGGLGFGLAAFAGGRFQSGAELFATLTQLPQRIAAADVIVTAEGAFDAQSLMGKGVGALVRWAANLAKPCICIAGSVSLHTADLAWSGLRCYAITPNHASLQQAQLHAAYYLEQLSARAARELG